MEGTAPYTLRVDGSTSDPYYAVIADFTDQWLVQARAAAGEIVDSFQYYQHRAGFPGRSSDENLFELLALGVLLREHGEEAVNLSSRSAWVMTRLLVLQEKAPWAEPGIKAARGLVGGLRRIWYSMQGQVYNDLPAVERLVRWLQALGEQAQAERLAEWGRFFHSLPPDQARSAIRQSLLLAADFSKDSAACLGRFTTEAEHFRTVVTPNARWRYDLNLITRSRLEYHLGMLGTEILNRAFRTDFRDTKKRLVIVPPCLRALPHDQCRAIQTPLGAQCTGCTPDCRIHQVTKLGQKNGVLVVSIPDDALTQLCEASGQAGSGLGVIGVACALRNWSAGWEAQRLGLHAQGVLLDYPGCKKHWNQDEVPTDVNFRHLGEIMRME